MITVETAIRAWIQVEPRQAFPSPSTRIPWRSAAFGERVLVFDTETSIDFTQRLLFGVFRIYEHDRLELEGLITADNLSGQDFTILHEYAARRNLRVFIRTRFVEDVFYPEVYVRGTLCGGFNLPFDLSRIALRAGSGRGKNRRQFRFVLTSKYVHRRGRTPDSRLAAFQDWFSSPINTKKSLRQKASIFCTGGYHMPKSLPLSDHRALRRHKSYIRVETNPGMKSSTNCASVDKSLSGSNTISSVPIASHSAGIRHQATVRS